MAHYEKGKEKHYKLMRCECGHMGPDVRRINGGYTCAKCDSLPKSVSDLCHHKIRRQRKESELRKWREFFKVFDRKFKLFCIRHPDMPYEPEFNPQLSRP